MKILIAFILLFLSFSAQGQKKYSWPEFLKELSSDTTEYRNEKSDSFIIGEGADSPKSPDQFETIDPSKLQNGKLLVDRKIQIQDIKIVQRGFPELFLANMHFKKKVLIKLYFNEIHLQIHNCIFDAGLEIGLVNGGAHQAWLMGNEFNGPFDLISVDWEHVVIRKNTFNDLNNFNLNVWNCNDAVEITENRFLPDEPSIDFFVDKIDKLRFNGNQFNSNVSIGGGSVDKLFELNENTFKKHLIIEDLILPLQSRIEWGSIGNRLAVQGDSTELYEGVTVKNLKNKKSFKKLIETYKTLYDVYKSKGDLESSNACFIAAKNLEGDRMKALYETEGGFKKYFSWKLNRVMKIYTNHATDPALALVVSIYILLAFAVFYFFFPSEWDVESKGNLVRHYQDFIQKNDKGYIKPFFKMALGFFVSFINALTLSLNSFVTLGFGNIPTKGLARYVCIVQGFIGWFLLSIFTVALFNQVLF